MKIQTDYKTSYGTTIPASTLRKIRQDILDEVDYQKTQTDHLRDLIPSHDEDTEEANEIMNHVERLMEAEGEIA
jgi:hypothetical protein